eukprot:Nitzschia sp. Nitz4//scaffold9_size221794//207434//210292//NITZ4_001387-RA/size221794-snap-gene-0.114-mRNA-1//1//CDS//3329561124//6939//frame0
MYALQRSTLGDPQGYQNSHRKEQKDATPRCSSQSPNVRRPPLSTAQKEPETREVLYNSFTSSLPGQGDSRGRDPPSVASRDIHKSRRVLFSKQLEVHEKQKPQTPSTPTIPILRSRQQQKSSRNIHNNVELNPRARDPTPRGNFTTKRSKAKQTTTLNSKARKTITDILNEQLMTAAKEPESQDSLLQTLTRPLPSSEPPKSTSNILADLQSKPTGQREATPRRSDVRKSMDPDVNDILPSELLLDGPSQQHWDMTSLFSSSQPPVSPLGMQSIGAPRETSVPRPQPPMSDSKVMGLKAFAPRQNHWDAPDLYPEVWMKYYENNDSPSNSSNGSDAHLIKAEKENQSKKSVDKYHHIPETERKPLSQVQGKGTPLKVTEPKKEKELNIKKESYIQFNGEECVEGGTELVLIPRVPEQIEVVPEPGSCLNVPKSPKGGILNFGNLLKRATPARSKQPFEELPVLALSFDDSVELKKGTDDTGESSGSPGAENGRASKWDTFDRDSHDVEEDDEFLIHPKGAGSWCSCRFFLCLLCLVFLVAAAIVPVYLLVLVPEEDDVYVERNHTDDDTPVVVPGNSCVDGIYGESTFSSRYSDARKVIVALSQGNSTKVDEPATVQRRAACWLADEDELQLEIGHETISEVLQRYTLALLYYTWVSESDLDQRSMGKSDFLSSAHECEWDVVLCGESRTVSALLLTDSNLAGRFPEELANLNSLSFLEITLNEITGTIPTEIGELSLLEYFAVAFNSFSGTIPSEIGLLTKLEFINMRSSDIEGTIPTQLGNLGKLKTLLLEGNWLSGSIPSSLGNLINIEQMSFRKNYLTGDVAQEICELTDISLKDLEVDSWIDCDCCTS